LDDVEAHAAAAHHRHCVALGDLGGVEGGTHAGEHPAADEGRHRPVDVVGDLHRAYGGDDGVLRECAGGGHLEQRGTTGAEAGGAVEQSTADHGPAGALAEVALAPGAEEALSALGHPGDDHVVSGAQALDPVAHLDHLSRPLVAEDDRGGGDKGAVLHRQVGVAHPRGAHPDLDLTGVRGLDLYVLVDLERAAHCGQHGGSVHALLLRRDGSWHSLPSEP
jgi:hypothetical protein